MAITIQPTVSHPEGGEPNGYKRFIVPMADLCKAIEENNLEGVIREALRPLYGESVAFETLVPDFRRTISLSIIEVLKKEVGDRHLAVLFCDKRIKETEAFINDYRTQRDRELWWVGESQTKE